MVLLMSGCAAVGPDYQPPTLAAPQRWQAATPVSATIKVTDNWWQTFNDAELNHLIDEAGAANLDFKKALARIKDVRAQRVSIFAAALPSLSARSAISRRLNNSAGGGSAQSGSPVGGGFGIGNQFTDIFQTGFDAVWELDFFGGVQRAAEAADATVASEIENSRDVLVTLRAEVARAYLELRTAQQLLAITQQTIEAQQDTFGLTQIRQQSGLANSLEVSQAQAQLAATQAQLPDYEAQIQQKIHALGVLLGLNPTALTHRLQRPAAIPQAAAVIPELPSELLKRRPDIRRAERLLAVAVANVGVATAELYPKLNLSAFLGVQNMKITEVTPVGKSWSTAASLAMPFFNWGRLQADIKSKQAVSEETLWAYKATVLTAFKEVEDALVAYSKEQQRHNALEKAVAANQLAVQLAGERYQKGLTGFIDVLDSQQALYQTQNNLANSTAAVSGQLVALYKALGGGWQTEAKVGDKCAACENSWPERIHRQTRALLHKKPRE
jgi:NodT family efflux transporter outer membrane factor (OMF) lipoprotein